jgi:hypothetical protein
MSSVSSSKASLRKNASATLSPNSPNPLPIAELTTAADFVPATMGSVDGVLMPIYVCLLLVYSIFGGWLSHSPWYTFILFYIAFMLAFYVWHVQAHLAYPWFPCNTRCRAYHREHHWDFFPPSAFYGTSEALAAGQDAKVMSSWMSAMPLASSPAHEALLYMFFVSIMVIGVLLGLSRTGVVLALIEGGVIGIVGNYLHISFHVKDHWLGRNRWTKGWWHELQAIHFVHHVGAAHQNYAMVNFAVDRIFHSYFATADAVRGLPSTTSGIPAPAAMPPSTSDDVPQLSTASVSLDRIQVALRTSPLSHLLFTGEAVSASSRADSTRSAHSRGAAALVVRLLLVGILFCGYAELQAHIAPLSNLFQAPGEFTNAASGACVVGASVIRDAGLAASAGAYAWLLANPVARTAVIAASAGLTDASALLLVIARAIAAAATVLPPPPGSLWTVPVWHAGIPSFLHPFLVSAGSGPTVQFFSGAVALGAVAAFESLSSISRWRTGMLASVAVVLVIVMQCAALVSLHAHWSVDILTGLLVGRYAHLAGGTLARFFDSVLP